MKNISYLTYAIFFPIFFGLLILLIDNKKKTYLIKLLSVIGSIFSFLITIQLYINFDKSTYEMQFVQKNYWIECLNIYYYVGIDGISLCFILLTSFVTIIVIISSIDYIDKYLGKYISSFLILSGFIIGAFASLDGILFYIFFESTLIPMYIIIGMWGGKNKQYASFKLFLYTISGSIISLLSFIYLFKISDNSFNILIWHQLKIDKNIQIIIFLSFFITFAIKIPILPFHTWLPIVHVEAPTGGSIFLASVMLKLGAYGFLRFSIPITPIASNYFSNFIILISLVSIIYIGIIAIVQKNIKKIIAYSSIFHMGFVTIGLFVFNIFGLKGSIIEMISHGLISSSLFICIGIIYSRGKSLNIKRYCGLVVNMPKFTTFFIFFIICNISFPMTSGFVGEFMIIIGLIKYNFILGFMSSLSLILSSSYSIWMIKRLFFGDLNKKDFYNFFDIDKKEFLLLMFIAVLIIYIGIMPKCITEIIDKSSENLLNKIIY